MTSSKKKILKQPVKPVEIVVKRVVEPLKVVKQQRIVEKKPDLAVEKQLEQPFLAEPLPVERPKQPEKVVITPSEVIVPVKKGQKEPVWDNETYRALANSVHQSIANILQVITNDKVVIRADKIERLDKCGVALLKKYDENGLIEKYGLELTYGLTLLDIGSQVYIELQRQKHEEKPKSPEMPGAQP